MNIKLGLYRSNIQFIKYCYQKCNHGDLVLLVSEIATSIHMPCIAVNMFLQEIAGSTKELQDSLENLKNLYNVKEIIE